MSVAQGYVYCGSLSVAVLGCALLMLWMGFVRRADYDEGAVQMLRFIGFGLIVSLGALWAFALAGAFGVIR